MAGQPRPHITIPGRPNIAELFVLPIGNFHVISEWLHNSRYEICFQTEEKNKDKEDTYRNFFLHPIDQNWVIRPPLAASKAEK